MIKLEKRSNQNLSNCKFESVDLTGTDFTNAIITGVQFNGYERYSAINPTIDQIKSTWNYKNNRMDGIKLPPDIQKELDKEKQKNTKDDGA
ncbi:MAG: pentapeptide repeat-containing protein [Planctomycetaceae bacterium]|nr:pentapeptide repeat-containing protein [Planctomycetaceae bacterium]